MSVKIAALTTENVKRVKSVHLEPSANGLTIIGGNNNNGKTSILDSIAWALGGNKYRPTQAQRDGSVVPPSINLQLSNGLIVERKGKNSDLKVTDPSGQKAGQGLLDSFVEELAINLPKFMNASNKEKATTLLNIIGVGDQLAELDQKEAMKYNDRLAIGRIADQKSKFVQEMEFYPEAPKELVSISDLIQQQQVILARNGENQKKRQDLANIQQRFEMERQKIEQLKQQLQQLEIQHQMTSDDLLDAQKTASELQDESTEELEASIANIELINLKVRTNLDRERAEADAQGYKAQYDNLTKEIEDIRRDRMALLDSADLPLPGLTVHNGELLYLGQQWDNMSGSQQLIVASAITRKLKPECGFILVDKLEQMDMATLKEFGEWAERENLQVIATRVSTGDECSIIIEDGYVKGNEVPVVESVKPQKTWTPGDTF